MQNLPRGVGQPGGIPGLPWVDPMRWMAAIRAGQAGNMLRAAKNRSKSIGIGKDIGGGGL